MVDSLKSYVAIGVGLATIFALTGQGANFWLDFVIKLKRKPLQKDCKDKTK